MATITIRNDFHNTSATLRVDAAGMISGSSLERAGRKLCGVTGCACSGWLGMRGVQDVDLIPVGSEEWHGSICRANAYRVESRNPVRAYLSDIGRKGGRVSSEAKARAARENGKRPKTYPVTTSDGRVIRVTVPPRED